MNTVPPENVNEIEILQGEFEGAGFETPAKGTD